MSQQTPNSARHQTRSRDRESSKEPGSEAVMDESLEAEQRSEIPPAFPSFAMKKVSSAEKRKARDSTLLITRSNTPKKPRLDEPDNLQDVYCWECHEECVQKAWDCTKCVRTFHIQCLKKSNPTEYENIPDDDPKIPENWRCFVCEKIERSESDEKKSWAMKILNAKKLAELLIFVVYRMRHKDAEAFLYPVPKLFCPDYYEVVFHPMDLQTLESNIAQQKYFSVAAFQEDAQWILHNCIIFNGPSSQYTKDAQTIMKICKFEVSEIELCPDCYRNSYIQNLENWFAQPCVYPHCLVWARLTGYPFWPAKALRVKEGKVDVRFFGTHDRAWVPTSQAYLLSKDTPQPVHVKNTKKFRGYDQALIDVELHAKLLKKEFGFFNYAPPLTEFKPEDFQFCQILFGSNIEKFCEQRLQKRIEALEKSQNDEEMQSDHSYDASSHHSDVEDGGSEHSEEVGIDRETKEDYSEMDDEEMIEKNEMNRGVDERQRGLVGERGGRGGGRGGEGKRKNEAIEEKAIEVEESSENGEDLKNSIEIKKKRNEISSEKKNKTGKKNDENCEDSEEDESRTEIDSSSNKKINSTSEIGANGGNGRNLGTGEIGEVGGNGETGDVGETGENDRHQSPLISKISSAQIFPAKRKTLDLALQKLQKGVGSPQTAAVNASAAPAPAPAPVVANRVATIPTPESSRNSAIVSSPKPVNQSQMSAPGAATPTHGPQSQQASVFTLNQDQVLKKHSGKILHQIDQLKQSFNDMHNELSNAPPSGGGSASVNAEILQLRQESQRLRQAHSQALNDLKHTMRLTMSEFRAQYESQHKIEIAEITRNLQEERERAIREAKSKQWCANCQKEAMFYCCWNTSYCDHRCQEHHWPKHQKTCAQIQHVNADSQNESSLGVGPSLQIPPNATYRPMPLMGSR